MRGILACWVRQAAQLEYFKKHQSNRFALHSKFNLDNGDIIYTGEGYPHLQVINSIKDINLCTFLLYKKIII